MARVFRAVPCRESQRVTYPAESIHAIIVASTLQNASGLYRLDQTKKGTGITPDVESDWPENAEEFTNPNQFNELSQEEWESKDAQMKKAREVLSEKVAQAEQ